MPSRPFSPRSRKRRIFDKVVFGVLPFVTDAVVILLSGFAGAVAVERLSSHARLGGIPKAVPHSEGIRSGLTLITIATFLSLLSTCILCSLTFYSNAFFWSHPYGHTRGTRMDKIRICIELFVTLFLLATVLYARPLFPSTASDINSARMWGFTSPEDKIGRISLFTWLKRKEHWSSAAEAADYFAFGNNSLLALMVIFALKFQMSLWSMVFREKTEFIEIQADSDDDWGIEMIDGVKPKNSRIQRV